MEHLNTHTHTRSLEPVGTFIPKNVSTYKRWLWSSDGRAHDLEGGGEVLAVFPADAIGGRSDPP